MTDGQMTDDLRELRADVARANHIAHRTGLVTIWGHISARVPGTDTFLIPPRASPALADADRLLRLDLDGTVLEGDDQPNIEFWIHARIYAARPDVGGVAHVHSPTCIVLSQIGETVRPIQNGGALMGEVPVYEDLAWISTRAQGDDVAQALGTHRAMLLRGHGANVVGPDVRDATTDAINLEEMAVAQLRALSAVGGDASRVRWVTPEEGKRVRASLTGGRQRNRSWDYYQALLEDRLP